MNRSSLIMFLMIMIGFSACLTPATQKEYEEISETEHGIITEKQTPDIPDITLPDGFVIKDYADVPNARGMCLGAKGTVFVGSRGEGKVYAIRDEDNDGVGEKVYIIDKNILMPVGVAFKDGSLYVSAVSKIFRYDDIEDNLDNPPSAVLVSNAFPTATHHGWKFIAFGPDDKLYVPVGAPCNICNEDPEQYANIMRMNPDGSGLEVYAKGIRNTVGFDWHPETGALWFTDNGRDWMGDDYPPCELNVAPTPGLHFGYPHCHGGIYPDPEFGSEGVCEEYEAPVVNFTPHSAPLGMRFYTGNMFPTEYKGDAFVAKHGSWNRSDKSGYKVLRIKLNGSKVEAVEDFITGFEYNENVKGRPVDVLVLNDGSMLVSDDYSDKIYRVTYNP